MLRILLLLALGASPLAGQLPPGDWKTDLSKRSIDLSELEMGGPPKDGIPAIDHPQFVSPREADSWLHPQEPALVIEYAGEVRAYPLQILLWHELVNDQIGDLPVLVSFCPLCNSAIAFDRRVNGKVYSFGVSGALRKSDMVMYDRETDSLWQQLTGEAIVGALTGKRLEVVSSQVVHWSALNQSFPEARILNRPQGTGRPYGFTAYEGYEASGQLLFPSSRGGPSGLKTTTRLLVLDIEGRQRAYPFSYLKTHRVIAGKLKGTRYVIFFDPKMITAMGAKRIAGSESVGTVGVFSPELGGGRLKFREENGKVIDKETGSEWNVLGLATHGELRGQRLKKIPHHVFFAFAWLAFHPRTEIIGVNDPLLGRPLSGRSPTGPPPLGGIPGEP